MDDDGHRWDNAAVDVVCFLPLLGDDTMQDVIVTVGSAEEADDVVAVLKEAEEEGLLDFAFNVKIQPAK